MLRIRCDRKIITTLEATARPSLDAPARNERDAFFTMENHDDVVLRRLRQG